MKGNYFDRNRSKKTFWIAKLSLPIFILVNIQVFNFRILVKGIIRSIARTFWITAGYFYSSFEFWNSCEWELFRWRGDHRSERRNRWKTFLIVKVLLPIFILESSFDSWNTCEWELFLYRNGRKEGSVEIVVPPTSFSQDTISIASEKSSVMKMLTFSLIPWSFLL